MDCKEFKHKLKELIEEHVGDVDVFTVEESQAENILRIECDNGDWFAIQICELWELEE